MGGDCFATHPMYEPENKAGAVDGLECRTTGLVCYLIGDLVACDGAESDPKDSIDVLIVCAVELV